MAEKRIPPEWRTTMSIPLAEALQEVDLKAGMTYQCEVKGLKVVVRVLDTLPPEMLPAPLVESDIMLEPWVELPPPEPKFHVIAKWGPLPLPDPPVIPDDEEENS
jgi:hypothetical protein